MRRVAWFSCGAASAVAAKLSNPDVIAYCETGAEHDDNERFLVDCEKWFKKNVTRIKSEKYSSTWEVWESRKYLSGVAGAPCTGELKVKPRLRFQQPGDVQIFGYTSDAPDIRRAEAFREHWPDVSVEFPLIDRGLSKAACLSMVESAGISVPVTYSWGLPNANCLPCVKATSPAYWAVIRDKAPEEFQRMAELSRKVGARLCRLNGERVFIDEIPEDAEKMNPLAPECDMLCALSQGDL